MKIITNKEYSNLSIEEQKNFTGIVKYVWGIKYFKNGKYHREDGPAFIVLDGYKEWYFEGKLHNVNGPAFIDSNGYQEWRFEGKTHNLNGAAKIYPDGKKEYWVYGKKTTKEAVELYIDLMKLKEIGK